MVPCRGISYTIVHKDQLKKNPNILTDWFEEIKPAEPIIKNKKIRKAVRAWAEANGVGVVIYNEDNYRFYADDTEVGSMIEFEDMPEYIGLRHEHRYTIEELCGEEE